MTQFSKILNDSSLKPNEKQSQLNKKLNENIIFKMAVNEDEELEITMTLAKALTMLLDIQLVEQDIKLDELSKGVDPAEIMLVQKEQDSSGAMDWSQKTSKKTNGLELSSYLFWDEYYKKVKDHSFQPYKVREQVVEILLGMDHLVSYSEGALGIFNNQTCTSK